MKAKLFVVLSLLALASMLTGAVAAQGPGPARPRPPAADGQARLPAATQQPPLPESAPWPQEGSTPASIWLQQAQAWNIQRVDAYKTFSDMRDRSLRLDAAGHPHIAYGADHLYYAWHDGAAWHLETVDSSWGVGRSTSLALDAAGHPHISYSDATNGNLKYARWTGSAWAIETVDSGGAVGGYTSLALDAAGHPHISYYDGSELNECPSGH